jgi:IclR family pca regulon transcriptional regulator
MGRVLLAGLPDAAREAAVGASLGRHPAQRALTGAALAAELDRVREQGWAMVDGELEPGLRSIAAPLHDRTGAVVAAVNVSTSTHRVSEERVVGEFLPALRETAAAVDAELRLV